MSFLFRGILFVGFLDYSFVLSIYMTISFAWRRYFIVFDAMKTFRLQGGIEKGFITNS